MSTTSEQVMHVWIDAHFAGRLRPRREHWLREHLAGCERCKRYYRRHLMLERVDLQALGPAERLARGLGLRPTRPVSRALVLAPVAVLAGLVLLLALRTAPAPDEEAYTTRGAATSTVALRVYRLTAGEPPKAVTRSIARGDELAFAYLNTAGKKRLMVFGVDDARAIYWFYPAWQDVGRDPEAIPIRGGPGVQELPEAVSHDYRGGRLRIHALFLDRPLTVRKVEALVRASGHAVRLPLPGSLQHTLTLKIR